MNRLLMRLLIDDILMNFDRVKEVGSSVDY